MPELSEKIKKMPKFVQEAMASSESAEVNTQIGKKYNLSIEKIGDMVYVIGHTILKDISLKDFPKALEKKLRLSASSSKALSLDIALKKFLPLRRHFVGIEDLIVALGGELPEVMPEPPTTAPPKPSEPSSSTPPLYREPEEWFDFAHHKKKLDIKSALKKNPEIGKQLVGKTPIKIEGFEEPVKPSIKNWLTDYSQLLGTGWHSSVERSKYLFRSPNTQNLTEKERMTLSQILKSLDEEIPLPISPKTGLLVLPEPEEEEKPSEPPTPIRPPEIHTPKIPIEEPEERGPRIKGNVIDLKNQE